MQCSVTGNSLWLSPPLIEAVGFAPIYAACALLPLTAGGTLLVGIHYEMGRLFPETDYIDVSDDSPRDSPAD